MISDHIALLKCLEKYVAEHSHGCKKYLHSII